MKGRLNIDINFPIISLIGQETVVFKNLRDYTICPKSYVAKLNKIKELIFDSKGILYERKQVKLLSKINPFGGFSLKFAQFEVFHVEKDLFKIKDLSKDEIVTYAKELLKFNKLYLIEGDIKISTIDEKLSNINNKVDAIKMLFFLSDPTFK